MQVLITIDLYFKNKSLFYQEVTQFLAYRNVSYIRYLEIHIVEKDEESYLDSSFRKRLIKLEDLEKVMLGVLPSAFRDGDNTHAQLELVFMCLSKDKLPICVLETGDVFQEIDTLRVGGDAYEGLKIDYSFASKKHNLFVRPASQLMARAHSIKDLKHPVLYDIIIGVILFLALIYFFSEW